MAVLVVVRALGPRLLLGLPVLVKAGTEAVIDVLVLRPAVGELLPESRVEWRIGGRFVIKHQFAGA
jgi:hypothetical protein